MGVEPPSPEEEPDLATEAVMAQQVVGGRVFATKKKLEEYCRDLLNSSRGRIEWDGDAFLRDLIQRHPDASMKIGPGISHFSVQRNPDWGGYGFWLHRVDGSSTDFSYRSCITAPTARQDASEAFRSEVNDQVWEFRDRFFDSAVDPRCPLTGDPVSRDSYHVDHVVGFTVLLQRFLEARQIRREEVAVEGCGDGRSRLTLVDRALAADWAEYHRRHAELRVVSPRGNLTRARVA